PRAIDRRVRASGLGLASRGSRVDDEPTVLSLVQLQCMTVALQVSLIRVEAMHDTAVCVSGGRFVCSRNDAWRSKPLLGRFESCDQQLDRAEDSSPASIFPVVPFAIYTRLEFAPDLGECRGRSGVRGVDCGRRAVSGHLLHDARIRKLSAKEDLRM